MMVDWNVVGAATVGSVVTAVASIVVARINRKKSPAEASDAISSAFSRLVDQLQEESDKHVKQITALREEGHRLRNQIMRLRGFAELVFAHVALLEERIRGLGGVPPDRPPLPDLEDKRAA